MNSILNVLKEKGCCLLDEPMKNHTTWGVGGPATIFAMPENLGEFVELIGFLKENKMRYIVIGNGSNLLFDDGGFVGVVVCTKRMTDELYLRGNTITAGAGVPLAKVAAFALQNGLSGLEWACGIPGTVGGAVVQNAGAHGKCMADVLVRALVLGDHGLESVTCDECGFGYRKSNFKEKNLLFLDACFALVPANKDVVLERMKIFAAKRIETQPSGRSAGSVFKAAGEFPAGLLIDKAGLKGTTVGGAQISTKHANFILNVKNATAKDIISLIGIATEKVYELFGIFLEREVEIVKKDEK